MPTIFAHTLSAITLAKVATLWPTQKLSFKFLALSIICACLPDADVIGFHYGIPYKHIFGHRGFTHSLAFALLWGSLVASIFYYRKGLFSRTWVAYATYFSLATASHPLLDAMTNGGLGVALYAPFNNERIFWDFRPIKVSPIGIKNFFSEWGMLVLQSEAFWIGIPCVAIILLVILIKWWR